MMDTLHDSEDVNQKGGANSSNGDSSLEDDSDDDSADLIKEKKIYSNEHKHHPETEEDFRWSIKPDTRLSNGADTMKCKPPAPQPQPKKMTMMTMLGTTQEEPNYESSNDPYLTSDDEDMYLDGPPLNQHEVPKEEKPIPVPMQESVPKEEPVQTEEVAPKKKKKKKKSGISTSNRSTGSSKKTESDISTSGRSTGSKKGKVKKTKKEGKKKKKKKKGGEESEEIKVKKPKKASLKDRIRASIAKIGGDKGGGVVAEDADAPQQKELDREIMAAIAEDEDEERLVQSNDTANPAESETTEREPYPSAVKDSEETSPSPEKETEAPSPSAVKEAEEPPKTPTAPQKPSLASLVSPTANMTPLQRFKFAGKKMQQIQQIRACAVDSQFAAAFNSNTEEKVNKGLMSASDKAAVDKVLHDLQQYEAQLEQERNQLSEDRDMLLLQQESVEHLLEEETQKTQELEARISELENILENQVYQQENEELIMQVQMLEAELERQEESLAKMAAEKQEAMKRETSNSTERTASMTSSSNWSSARGGGGGGGSNSEEDEENRSSSFMSSPAGGAKLQGELLQLRSSLNHKEKAMEEQTKEIARLREQLEQSDEIQKLSQVEATCEDFRKESKQFRSEVERLKKQLAEVESEKQAEIINVERLKQSEAEKTEALRLAEDEKNEALKKLDTHLLLSLNTTKTRESTINNVLDIGAPPQYPKPPPPAETIEEYDEMEDSDIDDEANKPEEKKNWFGFVGGAGDEDEVQEKDENQESGWFGFGGGKEKNDDSNETSGFFGFGKKEKDDQVVTA